MKVLYSWLKEFVDINLSPEALAEELTLTGTKVERVISIEDDYLLELEITPNRGDCLSIFGIAREISAILAQPLKCSCEPDEELGESSEDLISVKIKAPEVCPLYTARLITDVKISSSPDWLKDRLEGVGLRSINNVVDITNYCLIEFGHPLHAFDLDKLTQRTLIVRYAYPGEEFIALDGRKHSLDEEMLVIADKCHPIALAGIIGGAESEVTSTTKNILLESAFFDPLTIRKTAKRLNIQTESSIRFERGANPAAPLFASQRAANLINQIAGGKSFKVIIRQKKAFPPPLKKINLPQGIFKKIIGIKIPQSEVIKILERLHFKIEKLNQKLWVTPPYFRRDIHRKIDLVEEIARLYRYQKVPNLLPPISQPKIQGEISILHRIKEYLVNLGFYEVVTYSLSSQAELSKMRLASKDEEKQNLKLQNPLTPEQAILRRHFLPSLLKVTLWNFNRGVETIKIFEEGKIYFLNHNGAPQEKELLVGLISGVFQTGSWRKPSEKVDFFNSKAVLEGLLDRLGIREYSLQENFSPYYEKGLALEIKIDNQVIGELGQVDREVSLNFGIKEKVFFFQIDLGGIESWVSLEKRYQALPKYPAVARDIAVVVKENLPAQKVLQVIKEAAPEDVTTLRVFDLYRGHQVPRGYKSLGIGLTLRARNKTLTDDEINNIIKKVWEKLTNNLGAIGRE
jgi:phenylalanyl-tRNA synthetase beta chain